MNIIKAALISVLLSSALSGIAATSANQAANQLEPVRDQHRSSLSQPELDSFGHTSIAALSSTFDAYMKSAVQNAYFSGTVLVALDGVPLFQRSYGLAQQEFNVPNTNDTIYPLQSITKPFTALLILKLQEDGSLKVSDPACQYLDRCPAAWRAITIEHLLTHTSGIEGYSRLPDWDETLDARTYGPAGGVELVRQLPLLFKPGAGYRYSNSGYQLLALIIERVSGKTFPEVLSERILTPLNMRHSGFHTSRMIVPKMASGYYSLGSKFIQATPQSTSVAYGDSGITSTANDLLRWDQALYENQLVSTQSYEQMIRHTKNNYGYGWELSNWHGRRQFGHAGSGAGYSHIIARFIDQRVTIIVLSNSDEASAGGTAKDLAAILFGADYKLPRLGAQTLFLDALTSSGVEAAIQHYQVMKAAQRDLNDFSKDELLVSAGYALFEVPNMLQAKQVFEFAIKEFPRSAYSYDGLADIALASGDFEAASRHFKTSLRIDPTNDYAVEGLKRVRSRAKGF